LNREFEGLELYVKVSTIHKKNNRLLMEYGLSENQAAKLVAGSAYFHKNGGIDPATYWHDAKTFVITTDFQQSKKRHV